MQRPIRIPELNPDIKAKIVQTERKGFSEQKPVTAVAGNQDAVAMEQAHKSSQFALKELGSSWPRVEEMKKTVHREWTIPAVKHRISELKKEHRQQLAKAIQYQEHEYAQIMADEYSAFDDTVRWDTSVTEGVKSRLRMGHHLQMHRSDDFISSLRYSHIVSLKPLYEKLQQLLMLEDRAKQQRARLFPKTSQGWREMDTRDAKLKVARFLLMDKQTQDDVILRETDWRPDRADIDKVVLEYQTNIMFSEEVKNFVKESQTTDPRRRG